MLRLVLAVLLALTSTASPAVAQEAYVDDRSDAAAVVRSLYNAINRGEYARAWSYFSQPPAENVEAYARGYADTERVELIVGTPSEEGAAGSIYFELPVAIRAESIDGPASVFAGCYTLRMADPTIGEEFEPLHIERGSLRPSSGALEDALPRRCGDGPDLPERDGSLEQAKAIFATLERCTAAQMPHIDASDLGPDVYEIGFRYDYQSEDEPERIAKLIRFLCYRGAYNEAHIYFLDDGSNEVSPLHFAHPALDIRYADDDNEVVESLTVIGFTANAELVNSTYDAETRTIDSFTRWRGLADASSSGRWVFREGQFNLVAYYVDASYDGEQNGDLVVDYENN